MEALARWFRGAHAAVPRIHGRWKRGRVAAPSGCTAASWPEFVKRASADLEDISENGRVLCFIAIS